MSFLVQRINISHKNNFEVMNFTFKYIFKINEVVETLLMMTGFFKTFLKYNKHIQKGA